MSAAAVRMDELFASVLAPLALGGPLVPPRPIGARLAAEIADLAEVFRPSDDRLAAAVHQARAARARTLWPLDDLGALSPAEWTLAAALSDLLQVVNPKLVGVFGGSRPARLLSAVEATLTAVAPLASPRDALARHATFAALLELERHDASLSWWTGSARFFGEAPPARLLAWPRARRVSLRESRVPLDELSAHLAPLESRWREAIARFFAKTPLTELARGGERARAGADLARLETTAAGRALVERVRRAVAPTSRS